MKTKHLLAAALLVSALAGCKDGATPRPAIPSPSPASIPSPALSLRPVTLPSPTPTPSRTVSASPKPKASPSRTASPTPKPSRTTARPKPSPTEEDVYFANCSEAQDAGAAPLRRGDPGYRSGLDRDGDGVACEG